jgi:hypothetical protein
MAWPRPVRPRRDTGFTTVSPPSRPNSVLKIGSHPPHAVDALFLSRLAFERALGSRMTRTMWIALFCLVGLSPAIAIKVVTRPASLAVEADQNRTEMALAPNEAAKADRLPLHDIRAETEIMPVAQPEPSENPAAGPDETVRIPGRRWQDANAKAFPGESLPRTGSAVDSSDENTPNNEAEPPSRFNRNPKGASVAPSERARRRTIARRPIESASSNPPKPREVWHCRQDAMGSVLRSLDLSPRCHM